MPTMDELRRHIPLVTDGPPDIETAFRDFSLSTHAPVPVATRTEAGQLAAQLAADGRMDAFPLIVWEHESLRLLCMRVPDSRWEIIGGRLHGAQAEVESPIASGVVRNIQVTEFRRQSVGFTRSSDGGVVIPEDGLYRLNFSGRLQGIVSSDVGRRFGAINVNGVDIGARTEFDGDTHFSVYGEWSLNEGDVVVARGYHLMGSIRTFSGLLGIYHSLSPSW